MSRATKLVYPLWDIDLQLSPSCMCVCLAYDKIVFKTKSKVSAVQSSAVSLDCDRNVHITHGELEIAQPQSNFSQPASISEDNLNHVELSFEVRVFLVEETGICGTWTRFTSIVCKSRRKHIVDSLKNNVLARPEAFFSFDPAGSL